jgi:hypothetical protein
MGTLTIEVLVTESAIVLEGQLGFMGCEETVVHLDGASLFLNGLRRSVITRGREASGLTCNLEMSHKGLELLGKDGDILFR